MNVIQFPAPVEMIQIDPWHIHRAVIGAVYMADIEQLQQMRFALRVLRDIYPPGSREHILIHSHVAGLDTILAEQV
jgi:hypothetical protein